MRLLRSAISAQFVLLFCLNLWHLFMPTFASSKIQLEKKRQIGQLMQRQIKEFHVKAKAEIEVSSRNEKEKKQEMERKSEKVEVSILEEIQNQNHHKILDELEKISHKLEGWTTENLEQQMDTTLLKDISECKSKLLSKMMMKPSMADVQMAFGSDEQKNDSSPTRNELSGNIDEHNNNIPLNRAVSHLLHSSIIDFLDILLVEFWLLQPADEFAELGKQIEGQKLEIQSSIEKLMENVIEKGHLFTMHTGEASDFIPNIVKPMKKRLSEPFNKLLLNGKVFKELRTKHDNDEGNMELNMLLHSFDQLLNNDDPFLGPVSEQIFASVKAETVLPEGVAPEEFTKELGILEKTGHAINKALAQIHVELTKRLEEKHQKVVEAYENFRAFELLSSVSREMHRFMDATIKYVQQTPEQRERSLLILSALANNFLKKMLENLAKIAPQSISTVKNYLLMNPKDNLVRCMEQCSKINPIHLLVHETAQSDKYDLKVRIVFTAMHVLFRYEQLNRINPVQNSSKLMKSYELPLNSKSSLVQREVQKRVEVDVVPAQIGERLYQLFCVEFAKNGNVTDEANLFSKHRLFREALALQKMMGNYCKGKEHYEKHFKVNLEHLELAIAELEKHGGKNHANAKDKVRIEALVLIAVKLKEITGKIEDKLKDYYEKSWENTEVGSLFKWDQFDFDKQIKAMATIIEKEENPFENQLKAKELLEVVAIFQKAIVEHKNNRAKEQQNAVIVAYNAFARKLEMSLPGNFSRLLYERTNIDSFNRLEVRYKTNFLVKNTELMTRIRQLLTEYYQLQLPQMDVLKIRGDDHVVLTIGPIEYDFTRVPDGSRRRKFKDQLDENTSECSPKKASALTNLGLIKFSDADSIFYQMMQHGWSTSNYNTSTGKVCRTFVWNFLCNLFKGKCPEPKDFPANFLVMDRNSNYGSVFNKDGKHRFPIEEYQKKKDPYVCELKPLEITFNFDGITLKGTMENLLNAAFPLLLVYETGKYRGRRMSYLGDAFRNEALLEEIFFNEENSGNNSGSDGNAKTLFLKATKKENHRRQLKAKLMVYVCKVYGKTVAYVQEVYIANDKMPIIFEMQVNNKWKQLIKDRIDLFANNLKFQVRIV